jgi:phosphate-selective porin OprO and OprP
VNGPRWRRGIEAAGAAGPVSVSGEYMDATDARRGMGLQGEDLAAVHTAAWYAAGTWLVTGERKQGRIDPTHGVLAGGFGALEVAARVERMTFDSIAYPGTSFGFPTTASILANGERATTVGLTWYLTRYLRIQGNLVREVVDDPQRSPAPSAEGHFTSGVFLFQVAL